MILEKPAYIYRVWPGFITVVHWSDFQREVKKMLIRTKFNPPGQAFRSLFLLLPALAVFAISLLWPVYNILLRSFHPSGLSEFDGSLFLGHYTAILQDDLLRQVTVHSIGLTALSTAICAVLAFPAAYAISRLSKTASSLIVLILLLPFWVSIIVRLFAFTTILGQLGVVNSIAGYFDLGPFSLLYNTFATVVGMVAYLLPYLVLILLSAMMSVDTSLLTVARTMGTPEYFRRYLLSAGSPRVPWQNGLSVRARARIFPDPSHPGRAGQHYDSDLH